MITGDLVFTEIGSPLNAISAVTEGYRGARVNHVGCVLDNQFGKFVIEAFPPEVRLTHIKIYLHRSHDERGNPRYLVARLKPEYRHLIPAAIYHGLQQRDIPYDRLYMAGVPSLYCSELMVEMFRYANGGLPFFKESPMTFKNAETGEFHDYWVKYYDYFGMPVPEGVMGSNPGAMSRDPKLYVYNVVGDITGYQANRREISSKRYPKPETVFIP